MKKLFRNLLFGLFLSLSLTTSSNALYTKNIVDIAIQDQTTDIVDYFMCRDLFTLTLAEATEIDNNEITVVDATNVVVGTYVCLQENARAFQAKVLSKLGNVLTLDTPLDYGFSTSANINNRSPEMNVDGSVTPVSFVLNPIAGVKWDVTRLLISMVTTTGPADTKFGDLPSLTKGIVVRKTDGVHHTLFNVKNNGELAERMYDVTFVSRAVPTQEYGVRARRSFNGLDKNGVTIRLDGDLGEKLEVLIQDDLSGLLKFRVVAQGHIVED